MIIDVKVINGRVVGAWGGMGKSRLKAPHELQRPHSRVGHRTQLETFSCVYSGFYLRSYSIDTIFWDANISQSIIDMCPSIGFFGDDVWNKCHLPLYLEIGLVSRSSHFRVNSSESK